MIKAKIVADSLSPQGDRLTSVLCTFPRIILAEVNTHRMLSKNTSSSRAIPFEKMVEAVQNNPFIPIAWQKEHTGMQGYEYITYRPAIEKRNNDWLDSMDFIIEKAKQMNSNVENLIDGEGVTKQICNRLLEPFMWTTMLITGSREGWENFFELRCPRYEIPLTPDNSEVAIGKSWKELMNWKGTGGIWAGDFNTNNVIEKLSYNKGAAEVHMMTLAESIYDAVNESTPKQLQAGEWHIPFEDKIDLIDWLDEVNNDGHLDGDLDEQDRLFEIDKIKISTAMAAHTSYTVVGNEPVKSVKKWIKLHDDLISYDPPHSSPMEHCAKAMRNDEYVTFIKGRPDLLEFEEESDISIAYLKTYEDSPEAGWCNNFKGFIPYRYFIDNKIEL